MFDAAVYLAALEPPVFKDQRGRTHVGRVLGADDWFRLTTEFRLAEADKLQPEAFDRALRAFVDAIFPRPRWKVWAPRVSDLVWELPQAGRIQAVWDFISSQARASGTDLGTPSPSPAASAPPAAPSPA